MKKIKLNQIIPILLFTVFVLWVAFKPRLTGGELYKPDFRNGFDLYIEEGHYDLYYRTERVYKQTPYNIWYITDENVKTDVYEICKEITGYRELNAVGDIMLGSPLMIEHLPKIYINAGSYGYKISIICWQNYTISWKLASIKNEMFGSPLLEVMRVDMSLKPDDDDPYSFLKSYWVSDTVNNERGRGWYSTLPQEQLDGLLSLFYGINESVAEVVHTVEE